MQRLFLYSTTTWLAYAIGRKFYGGEHFVWCSPYFDASKIEGEANLPPTACPKEIYLSLSEEVARGDRHSVKIKSAKKGIMFGARAKRSAGVITDVQVQEIADILSNAEVRDFKPLLMVISYSAVDHLLRAVAVKDRAHPLSPEYIIDRLPQAAFDVLDFH